MPAFVALGGNEGDRAGHLRRALLGLSAAHGVSVERTSSAWETEAVGPPQPRYLNAVVQLRSCRTPLGLLRLLQALEAEAGRVRTLRWGPRPLDLDLLWHGGLTRVEPRLTLPHPRLHERAFVLAPLCELAPQLLVTGRTAADWLAARPEAERAGVVRLHPL